MPFKLLNEMDLCPQLASLSSTYPTEIVLRGVVILEGVRRVDDGKVKGADDLEKS